MQFSCNHIIVYKIVCKDKKSFFIDEIYIKIVNEMTFFLVEFSEFEFRCCLEYLEKTTIFAPDIFKPE